MLGPQGRSRGSFGGRPLESGLPPGWSADSRQGQNYVLEKLLKMDKRIALVERFIESRFCETFRDFSLRAAFLHDYNSGNGNRPANTNNNFNNNMNNGIGGPRVCPQSRTRSRKRRRYTNDSDSERSKSTSSDNDDIRPVPNNKAQTTSLTRMNTIKFQTAAAGAREGNGKTQAEAVVREVERGTKVATGEIRTQAKARSREDNGKTRTEAVAEDNMLIDAVTGEGEVRLRIEAVTRDGKTQSERVAGGDKTRAKIVGEGDQMRTDSVAGGDQTRTDSVAGGDQAARETVAEGDTAISEPETAVREDKTSSEAKTLTREREEDKVGPEILAANSTINSNVAPTSPAGVEGFPNNGSASTNQSSTSVPAATAAGKAAPVPLVEISSSESEFSDHDIVMDSSDFFIPEVIIEELAETEGTALNVLSGQRYSCSNNPLPFPEVLKVTQTEPPDSTSSTTTSSGSVRNSFLKQQSSALTTNAHHSSVTSSVINSQDIDLAIPSASALTQSVLALSPFFNNFQSGSGSTQKQQKLPPLTTRSALSPEWSSSADTFKKYRRPPPLLSFKKDTYKN